MLISYISLDSLRYGTLLISFQHLKLWRFRSFIYQVIHGVVLWTIDSVSFLFCWSNSDEISRADIYRKKFQTLGWGKNFRYREQSFWNINEGIMGKERVLFDHATFSVLKLKFVFVFFWWEWDKATGEEVFALLKVS